MKDGIDSIPHASEGDPCRNAPGVFDIVFPTQVRVILQATKIDLHGLGIPHIREVILYEG